MPMLRQTNSFAREKYLHGAFLSPLRIASISFSRPLNAVDFDAVALDAGAVFAAETTRAFSGCTVGFMFIASAVWQMDNEFQNHKTV